MSYDFYLVSQKLIWDFSFFFKIIFLLSLLGWPTPYRFEVCNSVKHHLPTASCAITPSKASFHPQSPPLPTSIYPPPPSHCCLCLCILDKCVCAFFSCVHRFTLTGVLGPETEFSLSLLGSFLCSQSQPLSFSFSLSVSYTHTHTHTFYIT